MSRTLLCLSTEKGSAVLSEALRFYGDKKASGKLCVAVVGEKNVQKCFESTIRMDAESFWVPVVKSPPKTSQDYEDLVRDYGITRILCAGWRTRIPMRVQEIIGRPVVIAHDSFLPQLRGFAPLSNAITSGLIKSGVTFFEAVEEVDAGPILYQDRFEINSNDHLQHVIDKALPIYMNGTKMFLEDQFPKAIPQKEISTTISYGAWRDLSDHEIDWKDSSVNIRNQIRAVGFPYLGAYTTTLQSDGSHKRLLVKCPYIVELRIHGHGNHGKIWTKDADGTVTIICGDGTYGLRVSLYDWKTKVPYRITKIRERFYRHGSSTNKS